MRRALCHDSKAFWGTTSPVTSERFHAHFMIGAPVIDGVSGGLPGGRSVWHCLGSGRMRSSGPRILMLSGYREGSLRDLRALYGRAVPQSINGHSLVDRTCRDKNSIVASLNRPSIFRIARIGHPEAFGASSVFPIGCILIIEHRAFLVVDVKGRFQVIPVLDHLPRTWIGSLAHLGPVEWLRSLRTMYDRVLNL